MSAIAYVSLIACVLRPSGHDSALEPARYGASARGRTNDGGRCAVPARGAASGVQRQRSGRLGPSRVNNFPY